MNKNQKEILQAQLKSEEDVVKQLKRIYKQSLDDITAKAQAMQDEINRLDALLGLSTDPDEVLQLQSMKQAKIYQKQYQEALKKQISGILDNMQAEEFKSISEYLNKCYEEGFIGTMYDLQGQGIPMCFPLDQKAVVSAVMLDSKISQGLYTRLGEDITLLKRKISAEVSRGISTGMSYAQMAQQLAGITKIGYNNAVRITATEGHRINVQAGMDACYKAKDMGADVVKQWDSTLDGKTRPSHRQVDGEIKELDEAFSNGLMFPGDPNGGAAEVVRCRCALLQRARWELDEEELELLKERANFFGLDKTANFEDYKKNYLEAVKAPTAKPKKEYLTKKKLEQKIADIEEQLKNTQDPQQVQQLEDLKAEYQEKLDKKIVAAETKKLKKEQILLKDQLDNYQIDTYSGIWKDDVTTKDWLSKKAAIAKKEDYFKQQLKNATDPAEIDKWNSLLASLDDFNTKGAAYFDIQQKYNKALADLKKLQKSGKISAEDLSAFTQDRKDAALWAKSTKEADGQLRAASGDVWRAANQNERYAIYDYTCGSGKFNRPLSGFEKPYNEYGSGWEPKYNKGVGNVWIDFEGAGDEIRHMTNIISRSTYDFDVWLQRGCGGNAMESFLGLSPDTFTRLSSADLQQFVGVSNRMYSFTSTGVAKGKGFSGDVILNIYAPKGTQMMYAEPFSHYGLGGKLQWDGVSQQSSFGYESEMIIQRGASYTITKIEKSNGTIFIDMEVHPEQGYELIQQDPAEWTGSTKKGR